MMPFRKPVTGSAAAIVIAAATIGVAARPAFAGVQACNGSTRTWAALYPSFMDWEEGTDASDCIGNKGIYSVTENATGVFCAGNNNGMVWYQDLRTGTYESHTFWNNTSYVVSNGTYKIADIYHPPSSVDAVDVYQAQITGWSGSAGC
jgi:hypothetical protein